jgi:hypothetical protein
VETLALDFLIFKKGGIDSKMVEDDVVQMIMSYGRCAEDTFLINQLDAMISAGLLGDIGSVTGGTIINFIKNYKKGEKYE